MAGELDPGSDTRDRPTVHEDVDLYLGAGDEEEAEEASEETKRGKKGAATLNWILGALPNEWARRPLTHLKVFLDVSLDEHKPVSWHAKKRSWSYMTVYRILQDLSEGSPGSWGS
jgi:hypothetical protein